MMISNVCLWFNVRHRVRIRPIAATYWLSQLIVSPLLVLFLVVKMCMYMCVLDKKEKRSLPLAIGRRN
ncbi:hypothetical protein Hanom_Chr03g00269351 [Helianthus anomalus]